MSRVTEIIDLIDDIFEYPAVRLVLLALLLYSLYRAVLYFSALRRHDAVRELQKYFCAQAYPRREIAAHLQGLTPRDPLRAKKLPQEQISCPALWVEKEDAELASLYFRRTGQRVSVLASESAGDWYGLEAWVRDIVASNGSLASLASGTAQNAGQKNRKS